MWPQSPLLMPKHPYSFSNLYVFFTGIRIQMGCIFSLLESSLSVPHPAPAPLLCSPSYRKYSEVVAYIILPLPFLTPELSWLPVRAKLLNPTLVLTLVACLMDQRHLLESVLAPWACRTLNSPGFPSPPLPYPVSMPAPPHFPVG